MGIPLITVGNEPQQALEQGLAYGLNQGINALVNGFQQKRQQTKTAAGLKDLAKSLGLELSEDEAMNIAGMPPELQKLGIGALSTRQQQQISAEGKLVDERTAQALSKASGGKIPANEFIGQPLQAANALLRAQEVSGVTGQEQEKKFLDVNVKRGEDLSTAADDAKSTLNISNEMIDLVQSGATSDTLSNLVEESNINALKPFFVTPGTKAYKAGFKSLFGDFKTTFGARPTQYEAQLFEAGLPSLLSSDDAKIASLYMYQAPRLEKQIKNEAHQQAVEELGYNASPVAIKRRQEKIASKQIDQLWQDTRNKIFGMIYKDINLPEGKALYWDVKNKTSVLGDLSGRNKAAEKGLYLIGD